MSYGSAIQKPIKLAGFGNDQAAPPENELPTWDDLRGRAPDATGKLNSEAFVRELRDGWE